MLFITKVSNCSTVLDASLVEKYFRHEKNVTFFLKCTFIFFIFNKYLSMNLLTDTGMFWSSTQFTRHSLPFFLEIIMFKLKALTAVFSDVVSTTDPKCFSYHIIASHLGMMLWKLLSNNSLQGFIKQSSKLFCLSNRQHH